MIISEIEIDTAEEWLETFLSLEKQIKNMEKKVEHKWKIESGMTKTGWYIKVLANKK